MQDQYLVKGELRRWNGPFHEVFSPVCVRSSSSLRPLAIGSYPLLTETESMEALHAARAAFDNGSGPWPSMTTEQRIACFEDFLSGMKANREEIAETYYVGNRETLWRFAQRVRPHHNLRSRHHKDFEKEERQSQRLSRQQGIIGRLKKVPLGVALCMGPFNYPSMRHLLPLRRHFSPGILLFLNRQGSGHSFSGLSSGFFAIPSLRVW